MERAAATASIDGTMPILLRQLPRIARLCREFGVAELSVFGSVLRDDFGPGSEMDFLVVFHDNDAGPWATKFLDLEAELSTLLGRPVDVVDKIAIERDSNWMLRRSILDEASCIYTH